MSVADFVEFSVGALGQSRIISVYGFLFANYAGSAREPFLRSRTRPTSDVVVNGDIYLDDPFGEYAFFSAKSVVLPYGFIVVPLTLASTCLLISKPRTKPAPGI